MDELLSDQPFDVRVFIEVDATTPSVAAVLYDVASDKEIASRSWSFDEQETQGFSVILGQLKEFCGNYPVWTFDGGQEVLERYCINFSLPFPFRHPFIRVRSLLSAWGVRPSRYTAGSLYQAAGLKAEGHTAGTLHDARSVARAVSFYENIGLL